MTISLIDGKTQIPALLRAAAGAYGVAVRTSLAAAGCDDLPAHGPFVVGEMDHHSASIKDLQRQLGVTKQAVSKLIDTLVLRGYLDRAVEADDRRRMTIQLTERGKAAAAAVRASVEAVDAELAGLCSLAELEGLQAGLVALSTIEGRLRNRR